MVRFASRSSSAERMTGTPTNNTCHSIVSFISHLPPSPGPDLFGKSFGS